MHEDRKMLPQSQVWPNEVALEFVENYKLEPMLWDPQHPDYRNKPKLHQAWVRIRDRMSKEVSVTDLKKKKESLMTAYRLHNRRRREGHNAPISWFAFETMDAFLGPIYNPPEDSSMSDHELLGNSEEPEYTNRPIKIERPSASPSHYTPRKRAQKKASEMSYSYFIPERDDIQDFDECELYARLLAKKMRKLDERQRDIVMHEIDNIMFRAKMNSEGSYSSLHKVKKVKPPESPVFIVTDANEFEEEYLEEHE